MGYALRTDRYRLVAWGAKDRDARDFELYDYQADPEETVNLARKPEHAERVKDLTALLDAGWKALQPK